MNTTRTRNEHQTRGWFVGLALLAAGVLAGACSATDNTDPQSSASKQPNIAVNVHTVDAGNDGCYVTANDADGVNGYVAWLLHGGANAGFLDKYDRCKYMPGIALPAGGLPTAGIMPAAETNHDCYTTTDDAPLPHNTNNYAVALLSGTANIGDLDKYMHCQYLPVAGPAEQ